MWYDVAGPSIGLCTATDGSDLDYLAGADCHIAKSPFAIVANVTLDMS